MFERDQYPAGVPCWVDMAPPDPEAAVAFYGALFGWQFDDRRPADSPELYFVAQIRGCDIAGVRSPLAGAPPSPVWNTYVCVENADETAAKARAAGGSVLVDPFDVQDAGRVSVCADPAGAAFCVWQPEKHRGAQLVNEPGTWNFSQLDTPDPEAAKSFYGAVFGWELTDFGTDGAGAGFWRMPGYGDFLAQRDPEVRERQADAGAPEGFEDAIAWLSPMSDRTDHGTPPQWSITFAVEDADATARKADELGGEIIVPPFDAPWVRMTVLRDPQGAVFTASKFVPPA
jgi:uncharacterized protein